MFLTNNVKTVKLYNDQHLIVFKIHAKEYKKIPQTDARHYLKVRCVDSKRIEFYLFYSIPLFYLKCYFRLFYAPHLHVSSCYTHVNATFISLIQRHSHLNSLSLSLYFKWCFSILCKSLSKYNEEKMQHLNSIK